MHLSRSFSFPKAFADRDRWCPFKRSHGSVLFLVLTTRTDTEPRWETHTCTDVDTRWSLHANIHMAHTHNMDVPLCARAGMMWGGSRIRAICPSIFPTCKKHNVTPFWRPHFKSRAQISAFMTPAAPHPPSHTTNRPSPAFQHSSYENKGKQNSADA